MKWNWEINLEVAHALHRVAWARAEESGSRYVEADRRLKRGAGLTLAKAPDVGEATLLDALAVDQRVAWDQAWFDLRWEAGEDTFMGAAAERVVGELNAIEDGGILHETWTVMASPVLAGSALACARVRRVAVGPRVHGVLALLTAIGASLVPALPLSALDPATGHWVRLQIAATALLRKRDDEDALTPWIAQAVSALLPLPAGRGAAEERVRRVAERILDQPPGEVERIADGLGRAQASRLQRAWRRGFFLPKDFDLDQWLAQRH